MSEIYVSIIDENYTVNAYALSYILTPDAAVYQTNLRLEIEYTNKETDKV